MSDSDEWHHSSAWGGVERHRQMADMHELVPLLLRLDLYARSPNQQDRDLAALVRELDLPWPKAKLLLDRLKDPRRQRGRKTHAPEIFAAEARLKDRLGREPRMSELLNELADGYTTKESKARAIRRHRGGQK